MVHVLDYLPNICHVWNHFYNPEIKNSKSSLFFLHTPLCWQGSGTFSGLVGHGKRIRVVRGLSSDSLHLGQIMFKTEMSLERSLQFK